MFNIRDFFHYRTKCFCGAKLALTHNHNLTVQYYPHYYLNDLKIEQNLDLIITVQVDYLMNESRYLKLKVIASTMKFEILDSNMEDFSLNKIFKDNLYIKLFIKCSKIGCEYLYTMESSTAMFNFELMELTSFYISREHARFKINGEYYNIFRLYGEGISFLEFEKKVPGKIMPIFKRWSVPKDKFFGYKALSPEEFEKKILTMLIFD